MSEPSFEPESPGFQSCPHQASSVIPSPLDVPAPPEHITTNVGEHVADWETALNPLGFIKSRASVADLYTELATSYLPPAGDGRCVGQPQFPSALLALRALTAGVVAVTITLTSQWLSATQVYFSRLLLHVRAVAVGLFGSRSQRGSSHGDMFFWWWWDSGSTSQWLVWLPLPRGTQHVPSHDVGQDKSQTS